MLVFETFTHAWVSRVYATPRRTITDGSAGSLRGTIPSARPPVSSVRRFTPPEQTMLLQILSIFTGATRGSAEGTALLDHFLVLTIWILSCICIPIATIPDYSDYILWYPGTLLHYRLRDDLGRLFGCSYVGRRVTCVGGELEFPQGEATLAGPPPRQWTMVLERVSISASRLW